MYCDDVVDFAAFGYRSRAFPNAMSRKTLKRLRVSELEKRLSDDLFGPTLGLPGLFCISSSSRLQKFKDPVETHHGRQPFIIVPLFLGLGMKL